MQNFATGLENKAIVSGQYGSFTNPTTSVSQANIHMAEALVQYSDVSMVQSFCVCVGENTETTNDAVLTLHINNQATNIKATIPPGVSGPIRSNESFIELTIDSLVCWKATGSFTNNNIKLVAITLLLEE